jgi:ribosomal protein S27AE
MKKVKKPHELKANIRQVQEPFSRRSTNIFRSLYGLDKLHEVEKKCLKCEEKFLATHQFIFRCDRCIKLSTTYKEGII